MTHGEKMQISMEPAGQIADLSLRLGGKVGGTGQDRTLAASQS